MIFVGERARLGTTQRYLFRNKNSNIFSRVVLYLGVQVTDRVGYFIKHHTDFGSNSISFQSLHFTLNILNAMIHNDSWRLLQITFFLITLIMKQYTFIIENLIS